MLTRRSNCAPAQSAVTRGKKTKTRESFSRRARVAFDRFVAATDFPCLGAKAAWHAGSYVIKTYGRLGSGSTTRLLAQELLEFLSSRLMSSHHFATFVAIFHQPISPSEEEFEKLLWLQLQRLDEISARS